MNTRIQSQVIIVGAGAAGDAAAFALRQNGFDGRIALVGADPHRPYERPYLSEQYLRDEIRGERVFLHPPAPTRPHADKGDGQPAPFFPENPIVPEYGTGMVLPLLHWCRSVHRVDVALLEDVWASAPQYGGEEGSGRRAV